MNGWNMLMQRFFLFFSIVIATEAFCKDYSLNREQYYIGPEIYQAWRSKKGGTKQDGTLYGVRLGYDRLKRYGWYWGGDFLYAEGTIDGHTSQHQKLQSRMSDLSAEVRFGYTFQQKCGWQASFTPFLGVGTFVERNYLNHSSPLPLHFKNYFSYVSTGFLFWFHPLERFEAGLNFKARFPFEPRCYVSNDPGSEPVCQNIKEEAHYRVDLPLTYRLNCEGSQALSLVPFFEYREYGGHPNFPFDFVKTNFDIWGATIEYVYRI